MRTLTVEDLDMNVDLDKEASAEIRGGFYEGGNTTNPWPTVQESQAIQKAERKAKKKQEWEDSVNTEVAEGSAYWSIAIIGSAV